MVKSRLSRRSVLQIVAVGGAAGMIGYWARSARVAKVERSANLMGTSVHFTVYDTDNERAAAAADSARAVMSRLDGQLSRFRATSEVGRWNKAGSIDDASDDLLALVKLSDQVSRWGEGTFDITVLPLLDTYSSLSEVISPASHDALERSAALIDYRRIEVNGRSVRLTAPDMRITLDGVAKGYIVDKAVRDLSLHGYPSVYVEAGGDLMAAGQKSDGSPWRIGIRHPREMAMIAAVDLRNRAIATSGDYMQAYTRDFSRHHIIDPRIRGSSPDLASATVIADDAATADALATTAMALGLKRGRELLEDLPNVEGFLVTKSTETVNTSGFVTV